MHGDKYRRIMPSPNDDKFIAFDGNSSENGYPDIARCVIKQLKNEQD